MCPVWMLLVIEHSLTQKKLSLLINNNIKSIKNEGGLFPEQTDT